MTSTIGPELGSDRSEVNNSQALARREPGYRLTVTVPVGRT
jgi:hypothetical protein